MERWRVEGEGGGEGGGEGRGGGVRGEVGGRGAKKKGIDENRKSFPLPVVSVGMGYVGCVCVPYSSTKWF